MAYEPTRFELALTRTEKLLTKVQKSFQKVAFVAQYDQNLAAYDPALRLAEDAERLTLMTRSLPVYTGVTEASLQVEHIKEATIPVQVGFTSNGWFSVRIPALLPRKSRRGSADYVQQYLAPALNRFFRDKEYTFRLEHCVLIYRHVYDRRRPERQHRDHDNIEINRVSNIIAVFTMVDDDPAHCNHYYCSASGPADRTEIFVVPVDDFPLWLSLEPGMPDQGVPLCENPPEPPAT